MREKSGGPGDAANHLTRLAPFNRVARVRLAGLPAAAGR
jgi:hypothetical protein